MRIAKGGLKDRSRNCNPLRNRNNVDFLLRILPCSLSFKSEVLNSFLNHKPTVQHSYK